MGQYTFALCDMLVRYGVHGHEEEFLNSGITKKDDEIQRYLGVEVQRIMISLRLLLQEMPEIFKDIKDFTKETIGKYNAKRMGEGNVFYLGIDLKETSYDPQRYGTLASYVMDYSLTGNERGLVEKDNPHFEKLDRIVEDYIGYVGYEEADAFITELDKAMGKNLLIRPHEKIELPLQTLMNLVPSVAKREIAGAEKELFDLGDEFYEKLKEKDRLNDIKMELL